MLSLVLLLNTVARSMLCRGGGDQDAALLLVWGYSQHCIKDGVKWTPFENTLQ